MDQLKTFLISLIAFLPAHMLHSQSQLVVQSGTQITLPANYLVLENTHLVNNGNILSVPGTFKFSGGTTTNISGINKPNFKNVMVAKTGTAQLVLQRDVAINGILSFSSGILHLNGHIIDLGNLGSLAGESETSHVVGPSGGYIQWNGTLNAPSNFNAANLGAILSTTQNLGNIIIRRGHQSQINGFGNGSSILRYFDILPTNNTSLNATLQINYLDAELNGLSENAFALWRSVNLTNWTLEGFNSRDASLNYVSKSAISSFSRWTIANVGNPLPVKFGWFNTACNGSRVMIRWATEMESNSARFEIQKSADARDWSTIGIVPAAGNSVVQKEYVFQDQGPVQTAYYRIAEFDLNGQAVYTAINRTRCGGRVEMNLWPNPVTAQTWLNVTAIADQSTMIRVIDQRGALVRSREVRVLTGNNIIQLDLQSLPAGNYWIETIIDREKRTVPFSRQ